MINRIKYKIQSSLRRQLIFLTVTSTTVLLLVFITFTYKIVSDDSEKKYMESTFSQLDYLSSTLNAFIESLERPILSFYADMIMNPEYLKKDTDSLTANSYLMKKLLNLYIQQSEIDSIQFYSIEQNETYIINNYTNFSQKGSKNIEETNLYQACLDSKRLTVIPTHSITHLPSTDGKVQPEKQVFSLAIAIYDGKYPLAILLVNYKAEALKQIIEKHTSPQETLYVVDGEDNPLASTPTESLSSPERQLFDLLPVTSLLSASDDRMVYSILEPGKNYIFYTVLERYPLFLIKTIPEKAVLRHAMEIRNLLILSSILLLLLLVSAAVFISFRVTSRLTLLKKGMETAASGNFEVTVRIDGRDELTKISETFSMMMEQIQNLIQEKYIRNLEFKKAQLKVLNAQINPHFLYNTLQAISSVACHEGVPEIADMARALSDMMRYSIKPGNAPDGTSSTLEAECKNARDYLSLQKFRFEDRLLYFIQLPEEAKSVIIPRLTLQPMIENAIIHGTEPMKTQGVVFISVSLDHQHCIIQVTDNGIGFPEPLLESMNTLFSSKTLPQEGDSMGIVNVYRRFLLLYGDQFTMSIQSTPMVKTTVTLTFVIKEVKQV